MSVTPFGEGLGGSGMTRTVIKSAEPRPASSPTVLGSKIDSTQAQAPHLVEAVVLVPDDGRLAIEVRGPASAMNLVVGAVQDFQARLAISRFRA